MLNSLLMTKMPYGIAQALEVLTKAVAIGQVLPTISYNLHLLQLMEQIQKLLVVLVLIPTSNQDTVVRIASHRDRRIVYEHALVHWTVHQAELLEEGAAMFCAMRSVQPMLDKCASRVERIDHLVCVGLLGGRENHQLEMLGSSLQEVVYKRSECNSPAGWRIIKHHNQVGVRRRRPGAGA